MKKGFRSKYEERVAKALVKDKAKFSYESATLKYEKPATHHSYTPDFVITTKSKKTIYVEAKGYFDVVARKKMVLVKRSNPDLDIRMLFQTDNPIRKGSPTYYTDWAAKNGFVCAVGDKVPKEWLNE